MLQEGEDGQLCSYKEGHGGSPRLRGAPCLSSSGGRAPSSLVSDQKWVGVASHLDAVGGRSRLCRGPPGPLPTHVRPRARLLWPTRCSQASSCSGLSGSRSICEARSGARPAPHTEDSEQQPRLRARGRPPGGRGGQCAPRRAGEEALRDKGPKLRGPGDQSPAPLRFLPTSIQRNDAAQWFGTRTPREGSRAGPSAVSQPGSQVWGPPRTSRGQPFLIALSSSLKWR